MTIKRPILICLLCTTSLFAGTELEEIRPLFPVLRIPKDRLSLTSTGQKELPLEDYLFTVQKDKKDVGSAFLLKDDQGTWMVSNVHVVSGDNDFSFVNISSAGKTYTISNEIQVAEDRDAIRFKVPEAAGLSLAENIDFDEVVYAFGNSGGAGVVTKNEGIIAGKGHDEIEVTCDIIPGNSGGPVINERDKVIGMATYIVKPQIWKLEENISLSNSERLRLLKKKNETEGTRYADVRRFAIHLNNTKWQPLSKDNFITETEFLDEQNESFDSFYDTALAVLRLSKLPFNPDKTFSSMWKNRYKRSLDKYGDYHNGSYYVQPRHTDDFKRQYVRWIEDISKFSERKAADLQQECDTLESLYLKSKLEKKIASLHDMAKSLLKAAEKLDR